MAPRRRRAALAVAAALGVGLFGGSPALAQEGTPADTAVAPPCESVNFGNVKLKASGAQYTETLEIFIPAGLVEIPEAYSWDSYPGREKAGQESEIWELQFLDADGNVIAVSEPSGDVPDFVEYGEWRGSLGTVELTEPAYGVRAHHRNDLYDDGTQGSVYPSAISICAASSVVTPPVETTTTTLPEVTVPPTTEVACPLDENGEPIDPDDPDCPVPSGPTTEAPACPVDENGVPTDPSDPDCPTTTTTEACPLDANGEPIDPDDPDCPVPAGPTTEAPAGPTSLPVTGSTTSVWLLSGLWLMAAGGTALAWVRHVRPTRA